jgi:hypothetical protein
MFITLQSSASCATAATATCRRGYFLPELRALRAARLAGFLSGLLVAVCAPAQQIALTIDRVDGPALTANGITGVLRNAGATTLELKIANVTVAGNTWHNVRLLCPDLRQERDQLTCAQGALEAPASVPVSFRYSTRTHNLDLALAPAAKEEWRLTLESGAAARMVTLAVTNGALTRLSAWWPAAWPKPNAGAVSGRISFSDGGAAQASAELTVTGFGFGDDSGLHAGEKITGALSVQALLRGGQWQWQSRLDWKNGDVFWAPLFVGGGGHVLTMAGTLDAQRVAIERGQLTLAEIGGVDFSAALDRVSGILAAANLKSVNVEIATLYDKLLKPTLQGTPLADLRCDGHADIALEMRDGAVVGADLQFKRVSIEDKGRRFALFGLTGSLPWQRDQSTMAKLRLDGGEVLRVPFGAVDLPLETRGIRVRVRDAEIPLFGGKLSIKDFATSGERESWRWRFTGGITPLSLEQLTTALGIPVMHGTLSAEIPEVNYQQSTLTVGGALLLKIFDGTVVAEKLVLEDPLGRLPRLSVDIDMRKLDLEMLTRTFSFGNITGRIDAQVRTLELVNWEAVHFDARIASSAGDYPRRISQAAVQNISALGGAGAAAAIQRSFLSFFETFGYSALGLSCRLESGVCLMGGIENVAQGYVIVRGGGIPAITVLGYNRNVGWRELIERLKRVTEGNVIVK